MIDQYPSPNGVLTSLIWRKTAAGGETSLSGYDDANQALSYTPGQEQVYLNGILLVRGDDYTATNGTSITGLSALAASDYVQVNCYNNFSVASVPSTSITGEITNSQITSLATSKLTGTVSNAQLANSSITINGSSVSLGGSVSIAGDIESVTAGTGLSGGGTSGAVTLTNDMATTISAKGDLVVGTGNDTYSALTAGSNGDTLVADSAATTGLRWQPSISAGRNFVINGNFDIWQRGTSFAANGYMADRWSNASDWSNVTFSQQTTGAPEGSRYVARLTSTGASSYMSLYQPMETSQIAPLWGKTVTLSIKLRTNATANNTGLTIGLNKNSTADASLLGAGWSSIASTNVARTSLPTTAGTSTATWYTATLTTTIPSDGTANSLSVYIQYNGATANGSIYEYSQVQLEVGSVPTNFSRAGGTLQGELAACLRYYERSYGQGVATGTNTQKDAIRGSGSAAAGTTGYLNCNINFTVEKRTAPTITIYDVGGTSGVVSRGSSGASPVNGQNGGTYEIGSKAAGCESSGTSSQQFMVFHYVASAEL